MKYGSQNAGDSTAQREKWIEEAADERVERLHELDRVLNRPLGSRTDLSREEKLQDWIMRLAMPEQTAIELQQRAQVVGQEKAELEFLVWDSAMRKLATGE